MTNKNYKKEEQETQRCSGDGADREGVSCLVLFCFVLFLDCRCCWFCFLPVADAVCNE